MIKLLDVNRRRPLQTRNSWLPWTLAAIGWAAFFATILLR